MQTGNSDIKMNAHIYNDFPDPDERFKVAPLRYDKELREIECSHQDTLTLFVLHDGNRLLTVNYPNDIQRICGNAWTTTKGITVLKRMSSG